MPKYNITEKRERSAVYRVLMSSEVKDDLQERINQRIIIEQKYRDKDYSAKQLADDLGTNVRYVSAVCAERFHTNYCGLVNAQRVNEAMSMLVDTRYLKFRMEDIGEMVGFSNRQSFYGAFFRFKNMTPRQYRQNYMDSHPELAKPKTTRNRSRKTA